MTYLDGLASESVSDRALQLEIADGYLRVAELAYSLSRPSLGRPEEAATYFDRADAIIRALEQREPDPPSVITARVRLDTARSQFLDDRGRQAEGLTMLERAIASAERAVALAPRDDAALAALAGALAELMATFEDSPAARAHLLRYLQIVEQRSARDAETAASLNDLGVAYAQAGKIADTGGDHDRARQYYRRGIELYERALARQPENATVRRDLMLAWNHLSELSLGSRGTSSYAGSGARFTALPAADQATAEDAARNTIAHATWLYDRDPANATVAMDFAIAVGRSTPAFPIGDAEAIRLLDRSLETLAGLSAEHAAATYFKIEFHGSRAERHRQRGAFALARRDWEAVRREMTALRASDSSAYRPQRMVIPMFQNWALTRAELGDRDGARAVAREVARLADEVAASQPTYARALGWPPRVQDWLAGFHEVLGEREAATRARAEGARLWAAIAARDDLPADLVAEARQAIGAAAPR